MLGRTGRNVAFVVLFVAAALGIWNMAETGRTTRVATTGETPRPEGQARPLRDNVTPAVVVAEGKRKGLRFAMKAQVVDITLRNETMRALCIDWSYGPGPGTGSDCSASGFPDGTGSDSLTVALDEGDDEVGDQVEDAYLGVAPDATETLLMERADGSQEKAQVYPAPEELFPAEVNFFVGFSGRGSVVAVRALDRNGQELGRKSTSFDI